MQEAPTKKRRAPAKKAYVPTKIYTKPAIPYAVSKPNQFWRIKKGLPADQYWKKRYWRRRITGKGDYVMDPSSSFGSRWGGYLGSKAGEFLGGQAQGLLGGVLAGLGDYNVRKNVFMSGRLPTMMNQPTGGGTVIRYQEYLCDIRTSATAGIYYLASRPRNTKC